MRPNLQSLERKFTVIQGGKPPAVWNGNNRYVREQNTLSKHAGPKNKRFPIHEWEPLKVQRTLIDTLQRLPSSGSPLRAPHHQSLSLRLFNSSLFPLRSGDLSVK